MPALSNPKHERFAQAGVSGEHAANASQCYAKVYEKPEVSHKVQTAASRLRNSESVAARISELIQEGATRDRAATDQAIAMLAINKERILAEYANIAFANVLDYVSSDTEGDYTVQFEAIERDQGRAISEIVIEGISREGMVAGGKVQRVRIKLANKQAALAQLSKYTGLEAGEQAAQPAKQKPMSEAVILEEDIAFLRDGYRRLKAIGIDLAVEWTPEESASWNPWPTQEEMDDRNRRAALLRQSDPDPSSAPPNPSN